MRLSAPCMQLRCMELVSPQCFRELGCLAACTWDPTSQHPGHPHAIASTPHAIACQELFSAWLHYDKQCSSPPSSQLMQQQIAAAIPHAARAGMPQTALPLLAQVLDAFSYRYQHYATATTASAKLSRYSQAIQQCHSLDSLASLMNDVLSQLRPMHLAKLSLRTAQLVRPLISKASSLTAEVDIAKHILNTVEQHLAVELCSAEDLQDLLFSWWTCHTIYTPSKLTLHKLCCCLKLPPAAVNHQHIPPTRQSVAQRPQPHTVAVMMNQEHYRGKLRGFSLQGLAHVLAALRICKALDAELLAQVAEQVVLQARRRTSVALPAINHMLHALTRAGWTDAQVYWELADAARPLLLSSPYESVILFISDLDKALASTGAGSLPHDLLFDVADILLRSTPMSPVQCVQVARVFSNAGLHHHLLFADISNRLAAIPTTVTLDAAQWTLDIRLQDIVTLVSAFASLGCFSPKALTKLADAAARQIQQLTTSDAWQPKLQAFPHIHCLLTCMRALGFDSYGLLYQTSELVAQVAQDSRLQPESWLPLAQLMQALGEQRVWRQTTVHSSQVLLEYVLHAARSMNPGNVSDAESTAFPDNAAVRDTATTTTTTTTTSSTPQHSQAAADLTALTPATVLACVMSLLACEAQYATHRTKAVRRSTPLAKPSTSKPSLVHGGQHSVQQPPSSTSQQRITSEASTGQASPPPSPPNRSQRLLYLTQIIPDSVCEQALPCLKLGLADGWDSSALCELLGSLAKLDLLLVAWPLVHEVLSLLTGTAAVQGSAWRQEGPFSSTHLTPRAQLSQSRAPGSSRDEAGLQDAALCDLYRAYLIAAHHGKSQEFRLALNNEELLGHCEMAWNRCQPAMSKSTFRELRKVLHRLCVEQAPPGSYPDEVHKLLRLDSTMIRVYNGQLVYVEVLGPEEVDRHDSTLGNALFRRHILAWFGIKHVALPHEEWTLVAGLEMPSRRLLGPSDSSKPMHTFAGKPVTDCVDLLSRTLRDATSGDGA